MKIEAAPNDLLANWSMSSFCKLSFRGLGISHVIHFAVFAREGGQKVTFSEGFVSWANSRGGLYYPNPNDQTEAVWFGVANAKIWLACATASAEHNIVLEGGVLNDAEANAICRASGDGRFLIGIFAGRLRQLRSATGTFADHEVLSVAYDDVQQRAFQIASDFVFQHELAHVVNGHVELGAAGRSDLDLQTLEMDADAMAFGAVLGPGLQLKQSRRPNGDTIFYRGPTWTDAEMASNARLIGAAIYAAIRVTDRQPVPMHELRLGQLARGAHPPPIVRFRMLLSLFITIMNRTASFDDPQRTRMLEAFAEGGTRAEGALAKAGGRLPVLDFIDTFNQDWMHNYMVRLVNNWATLRPLLEPLHHRAGRLAPAQKLEPKAGQ